MKGIGRCLTAPLMYPCALVCVDVCVAVWASVVVCAWTHWCVCFSVFGCLPVCLPLCVCGVRVCGLCVFPRAYVFASLCVCVCAEQRVRSLQRAGSSIY